jgi:hypothetical protein
MAVGGRRARVRVLDEDGGIQARLVDVVAQVSVVQLREGLGEDERSDVVAAAAQVLPASTVMLTGYRTRCRMAGKYAEPSTAKYAKFACISAELVSRGAYAG